MINGSKGVTCKICAMHASLKWTPMFKWSMPRCVVEYIHQKDIHDDKIGLFYTQLLTQSRGPIRSPKRQRESSFDL